jgi:tetratricopeptide (TPR) repeat protein/DNA-binding SARP family transcriptional activator
VCSLNNSSVEGFPELTPAELGQITDPAQLLDRAWAMEPPLRLRERYAALDRLEELLADETASPAPVEGRNWQLELTAERAIDAAANVRLAEATELADLVLTARDSAGAIATARATLAKARALAWEGTEEKRLAGERMLIEATEMFRELGHSEWYGFAVFWRGHAVYFEAGHLVRAVELMGEALEILDSDSPRRPVVLDFYADALIEIGELDRAELALDEAAELAQRQGNSKARAHVSWTRSYVAAARGDAYTTERLLREVEREGGDWFQTHIGEAFLNSAAMLLDRLGLTEQAEAYFAKVLARTSDDDETTLQTRAMMLARTGDPAQALDAMQELVRGDWLDKRYVWRHTLLSAWATFRGGREGAGELASRAFDQAVQCGGSIRTALTLEPELTVALAPLAERAGSIVARELMLDGRELVVRLFGMPSVTDAQGNAIELPAGMPGELVRMLALNPTGLPSDVVLETFFPDVPLDAARQRLRQVLTRLRASAGEIVTRSGEHLRLAPAWVDLHEFTAAADRVRAARGPHAVVLAYSALALWEDQLLPTDPYAVWAEELRVHSEYRHLSLLDLVAAHAIEHGSHQEALTALEAAMRADPEDRDRPAQAAEQQRALGRDASAAAFLRERSGTGARVDLDDVDDSPRPARLRN